MSAYFRVMEAYGYPIKAIYVANNTTNKCYAEQKNQTNVLIWPL